MRKEKRVLEHDRQRLLGRLQPQELRKSPFRVIRDGLTRLVQGPLHIKVRALRLVQRTDAMGHKQKLTSEVCTANCGTSSQDDRAGVRMMSN